MSLKDRITQAASINRRLFLQWTAAGIASIATGIRGVGASQYRVGIGSSTEPYEATLRAVQSTEEWPAGSIRDKTVVIKPNLVLPKTADTGTTTDPEVARALVDLAFDAGAHQVLIAENGSSGANFSACGYDIFDGYRPSVSLVDLSREPLTMVPVPHGLAYKWLYVPALLLEEDIVFISAAKLKTHSHTYASLAAKNLIGLLPIHKYNEPLLNWCGAIHQRGVDQTIVDLGRIRPIDYAVVDGVWGMEGEGPGNGDPVKMDLVVAGRNAVAVDRVCLSAIDLPQAGVRHLDYGTRNGFGPGDLNAIEVVGDPFTTRLFTLPRNLPPLTEYPRALPWVFDPAAGQAAWIIHGIYLPCKRRVEIVHTSETSPSVTHVRTLSDWQDRAAGFEWLVWDGKDDQGSVVPAGTYNIRQLAKYAEGGTTAFSTGWVWVDAL